MHTRKRGQGSTFRWGVNKGAGPAEMNVFHHLRDTEQFWANRLHEITTSQRLDRDKSERQAERKNITSMEQCCRSDVHLYLATDHARG